MRRLPLIAAVAVSLGLCACETLPAPPPGPVALGPGEWRVALAAHDAATARLGALRRAADLTLAQGGDWFRVLDRQGAGVREPGAGPGLMSGLDSPDEEAAASRREMDIAIGRGPKPEGLDIYDAREVATRLGGAAPRPRPPGQAV